MADHLKSDRLRGFDLASAPLVRVALFRLGPSQHRWVWSFPHILLDGGSFAFLVRDLYAAYDARVSGTIASIASRPPYSEFIEWLMPELDARREEARAFFRETLKGFESRNVITHRSAVEAIAPHQAGENQYRLLLREGRADADARAFAEREIT